MDSTISVLKYKGYYTKIEFDKESMVLYGKVEGIKDLVDFQSDSAKTIEKEFHQAVDDYLAFCQEVGKTPEKEYKGTFNVRITPALHRDLARVAFIENKTLNACVEEAVKSYVVTQKKVFPSL